MKITGLGAIALLFCLLTGARAAEPAAIDWAEAAINALPDLTQGQPAPPGLLGAALAGRWQGTLTYRDYGNNRRVVLPTSASIASDENGSALQVDFVYDDGPGKTVRSSDRWVQAGTGFSMEKAGAPLTVSAYRSGSGNDVTLVALGSGNENNAAVQVRMVLQRRGDQLTISRATQLPGQPWLLRHAYHFTQAK